jgi:hypothetical protein
MGRGFFFGQFCEVDGLTIIHKKTLPNLATGQRGKQKKLGILLHFGNMLAPIAYIWRYPKKKFLQIW